MRIRNAIYLMFLMALLPALVCPSAFAMPPHPDLESKIMSGELALPKHVLGPQFREQTGLDQPSMHPVSPTYPVGTGPVGSFNVLVLLVQFTDDSSGVNASFFDTLVFENQPGVE